MIGREKYSKKDKKRLLKKIMLLIFLAVIFLVNLIVISREREEQRKTLEAYEKQMETEASEESINEISTEDNVPNFGTSNTIVNLDEYATPLLGNDAKLLENCLVEYFLKNGFEKTTTSIFHVMIPEANAEHLYFFCESVDGQQIVRLTFDCATRNVFAEECDYTKEEIIDEIWEGFYPDDRDIQE